MKIKYVPHYTYEDYVKWQGDWELVEGIPYAMASPTRLHQRIVFYLQRLIAEELEKNSCSCEVLSDVDWIISEDTVLRPDIVVVCEEEEDYIRKTPLLIAEVVSKNSKKYDEEIKFDIYQFAGVPYYLLVYTEERSFKAYANTQDGFKPINDLKFSLKGCTIELDLGRVWR